MFVFKEAFNLKYSNRKRDLLLLVVLTLLVVQVCFEAKNSSTAESRLSPFC